MCRNLRSRFRRPKANSRAHALCAEKLAASPAAPSAWAFNCPVVIKQAEDVIKKAEGTKVNADSKPLIDEANGGSMLRIADTLTKAYNGIKNVDTIINGHMPAQTTFADLKEFADFNQDFLTWAQGELKAGKTPAQAATEWKIPAKYTGYASTVSPLFGGIEGRLKRLQDEMKKSTNRGSRTADSADRLNPIRNPQSAFRNGVTSSSRPRAA